MRTDFQEMLVSRQEKTNSLVCVGLDSKFVNIPKHAHQRNDRRLIDVCGTMLQFNVPVAEATHDVACAYKLNLGFYLAHGAEGISALTRTIVDIRIIDRYIPIILDGKFAEIGR